MKYTQNYNFRKPEDTDPADIQDLNYNADVIDSKLKEIEDWEAAHLQASNPHSITPALIGAETPTGAQQKANQAETNAKSYADTVANSALNNAKDYADGVLESANSRTDQVASDLSQKLNETRIKVLDVEQDVSNISKVLTNLNPNQEAKQSVSGYGIIGLPKNAANGQISVVVKGLTATNLINGRGDNLEGWTNITGDLTIEDNFFKYIGGAIKKRDSYPIQVRQGDKLYLSYFYKTTGTPNCNHSFRLFLGETQIQVIDYLFATENVNKELTRFSLVFECQGDADNIAFRPSGRTSETGHWYFKHIMLINLTQTFGAGNEPTKEECDQIFANYFDGTKSTVCGFRIRSVSQDESQESAAYVLAKDAEGKIVELRSLPNGTKDEISLANGKMIKRVGRSKDFSDVVWYESSEYHTENFYGMYARFEDLNVDLGEKLLANLSHHIINYPGVGGTGVDMSITDNYLYRNNHLQSLFLKLPKSAYADIWTLAETHAWFRQKQVTLIYQLAEPVEIPIKVSGNIVSYPSGTIYIERAVPDAGIYTDKTTVLHQDLPIKALEKISKVDFDTGLETELDITAAVIAEDKLSFTHPDLEAGDIVFFVYEYDRESTVGETEIEYYDSRYVIKDSVTGKFYKWHIAVADGVPSIELVEV